MSSSTLVFWVCVACSQHTPNTNPLSICVTIKACLTALLLPYLFQFCGVLSVVTTPSPDSGPFISRLLQRSLAYPFSLGTNSKINRFPLDPRKKPCPIKKYFTPHLRNAFKKDLKIGLDLRREERDCQQASERLLLLFNS